MFKNKLLGLYLQPKLNTQNFQLYANCVKFFTGKTETGFKFTTPKLRMKSVSPIFPPPGENLEIPSKIENNIFRMDAKVLL